MPFLSAMVAHLASVRAARADARARLFIADLPVEIRKDVGWPDDFAGQARVSRRALATETPH